MTKAESFEELVLELTDEDETWTAFADRAGVTTRIVQMWRAAGTKRPHSLTVRAIAAALRCDEERVREAVAESYRRAQ